MFTFIFDKAHRSKRITKSLVVLGVLLAGLAGMILLSVGIGAVFISPGQVLSILSGQINISLHWPFEMREEAILMSIRLPRVVLTILVGAALSMSGAALQGLFRNPLADPGLIGISSGAAMFAAIAILIGNSIIALVGVWFQNFLLPIAAFLGGIIATVTVYRISTSRGHTNVAIMLLAGIAINALGSAGIGYVIFMADNDQLRDITFWMLGSMSGTMWTTVLTVAPFILLALIILPRTARGLNALLLGETEARHLGISVEKLKKRIIVLSAAAVGASVAVTGIIGFIGLVVPHLLRLIIGPDHRFLLPGSAILGALLLLAADLVARTVVAPAELPIGIVTATMGAPFFLWLLVKNKNLSFYL